MANTKYMKRFKSKTLINVFKKFYCTSSNYEIPERYGNSFYLANAAFFDSTNWFLHKAYEVIFPNLKQELQNLDNNYNKEGCFKKFRKAISLLDQCNSIIDIRFPIEKDNGQYEIIRGFRAQHGLATGLSKCLGGFRISENVTRDQIKALSVLSTYKNACLGISFCGSHGAVKINPKLYSNRELQDIVQKYTMEMFRRGYLGIEDIIQPDVNTSEKEMEWVTTTFVEGMGRSYGVAAMGKPLSLSGLANYEKMGSQGAYYSLDIFLNNENIAQKLNITKGLKDKTFIIQGLGKLGAPLALYLEDAGAKCVGVKELEGYLYDAEGIDLKQLYAHREANNSIQNFGKCKPFDGDEIYEKNCDILILAACHKSLNCYVADKVKAKIIVEAADGAITPTANKILLTKSRLVLPDIFSCAGGTVASYLEYLKHLQERGAINTHRFGRGVYENIANSSLYEKEQLVSTSHSQKMISKQLDKDYLSTSLEYVFADTAQEILRRLEMHKLGLDIRTAAYIVAICNIFGTMLKDKKYIF